MFARQSWGWWVPGVRGVQGKAAGWLIILTGILCKSFPEESASNWRDKLYLMSTTHSFRKLWKTILFSCILNCISTWERERFSSQCFLYKLRVCSRRKTRIIPTFTLSVLFLFLIDLPAFSFCVQLISTSIIPTISPNTHQSEHTTIARAVIHRECEINSQWEINEALYQFVHWRDSLSSDPKAWNSSLTPPQLDWIFQVVGLKRGIWSTQSDRLWVCS